MSIIEIKNHFKLPIDLLKNKKPVLNNIFNDLELLKSTNDEPLYNFLFNPKGKAGGVVVEKWSEKYTMISLIDIGNTSIITINCEQVLR